VHWHRGVIWLLHDRVAQTQNDDRLPSDSDLLIDHAKLLRHPKRSVKETFHAPPIRHRPGQDTGPALHPRIPGMSSSRFSKPLPFATVKLS
jgi:hypothetical protein